MKKAIITGINGMDGSHLADFLLAKDYEVHGIIRRSSVFTTQRVEHLRDNAHFSLHYGDLADSSNLHKLVDSIQPNEFYNLGAESHVAVSFDVPEYCADVNGVGTLRILDAIKSTSPHTHFYQASTSEMFGGFKENAPQNEGTPFHPRSPYGTAKLYAYWATINYREAYGLHLSNGILFNHESVRRGETFVTKKATKAAVKISKGKQEVLYLGNLDAVRDWGYAPEYIEAMWMMTQMDAPDDYVIATGRIHTVREWVEWAFDYAGISIKWKGNGLHEEGYDNLTGKTLVRIDPKYFRSAEVEHLQGDASKAKQRMGWESQKTAKEICKEMVEYDLRFDDYGGAK